MSTMVSMYFNYFFFTVCKVLYCHEINYKKGRTLYPFIVRLMQYTTVIERNFATESEEERLIISKNCCSFNKYGVKKVIVFLLVFVKFSKKC